MSLFGRRKPGFSKEVELRPEDITDEFSDRNDPAMQRNSNPKEEKAAYAARAQAVMDGTAIAFAFPATTDGKARDFIVRLTMNAATSWSLPGGASFESDDEDVFAEVEPGATAVFFFFEIADDVFMVSRKAANAVAKEV